MFKKLFWGVIGAACVFGIVFGIVSIFNSGSEEKAEWSDSTFSTEAVEGREADNEAEDNDNNVNKENSDRASSKDEERVIVDYDYGACNNGCGCTQYAHHPGIKICVNCSKHDCYTSKYDHVRNN
jgi:hypothetical protein